MTTGPGFKKSYVFIVLSKRSVTCISIRISIFPYEMKNRTRNSGFTLLEALIVLLVIAILAATAIPLVADSTKEAKVSAGKHYLHTLRSQIEVYRAHHTGNVPGAALLELTNSTNAKGEIGVGMSFPFGPYIPALPKNPFTDRASVKTVTISPPTAANASVGNGGWLYKAMTGGIWLDHAEYVTH